MEKLYVSDHLAFERARVKLLYEQSLMAQACALLAGLSYVYLASKTLSSTTTVLLSSMFIFVYVARAAFLQWFLRRHLRRHRKDFDPGLWEKIFAFTTFLGAITWSFAGTFFMPASTSVQTYFAFLLAGISAGAVVAYSTSLKSVFMFLFPAIIPFSVKLAFSNIPVQQLMAFMMVLYAFGILTLVIRVNRYINNSIKLQFEREFLIKELNENQQKVETSTKMAAIGEMAGGLAHEINNPLTTIQFNIKKLQDMTKQGSLTKENLSDVITKVDTTVKRISKIVLSLKSFVREGNHDPFQLMPVERVMKETLELCYARFQNNGISLTVSPIPEDAAIICRGVQITQVLLNLLNNSFDAVYGTENPWVKVGIDVLPDHILITVTDSGQGVPESLRSKIMQPFFTTKAVGKGTGLGLSLSQSILAEHDGSLKLDTSCPNTRFVITLPRAAVHGKNVVA